MDVSPKNSEELMENLKNLLEDSGISVSDLADRLGVSRSYVSNVLGGESSNVSINKFLEILESVDGDFTMEISVDDRFSLADVARTVRDGKESDFPAAIKMFYRSYARTEDHRLVSEKPPKTGLDKVDAYLAAVADRLSFVEGFDAPEWANDDERVLSEPEFFGVPKGYRVVLFQTAPPEFKSRNVFVDENRVEDAIEKQKMGLRENVA